VPLWTVVVDRVLGGERVSLTVACGLLFGLGGVALLLHGGGSVDPVAAGAIVVSSLVWALAAYYARRATLADRAPLTSAGLQMVCAGLLLAVASVSAGEPARIDPGAVSGAALGAFLYLALAGSILAFLCFTWLNANASPTLVSTY